MAQFISFVWSPRAAWLLVLLAGLPLQDNRPDAAQAAYDYAWQLFVHGQLIQCQQQTEHDVQRFQFSAPDWVPKFQLLTAQTMLWRGLNADAMSTLSRVDTTDPNDTVQKLAIEASVSIKFQQFSATDQRLQQAEGLCRTANYLACGAALRARGVLAVDRGQLIDAHRLFLASLSNAQSYHDKFQEATAMINLSAVDLQAGHYDEAVDWSQAARRAALEAGAEDDVQVASGNLGYAYFELGDHQRALALFLDAKQQASKLGALRTELKWLEDIGLVYQTDGDPGRALPIYQQALGLAKKIDSKFDVVITLEDLAYAAIEAKKPDEASAYLDELTPLAETSGNRQRELLVIRSARGKIAAARRQDREAEDLLRGVEEDRTGQTGLSLGAGNALAQLYEREDQAPLAEATYRKTLASFESVRAQLKKEESRLPFLANAESLYNSYIHFLVSHNKSDEALAVADQSRAQTLAEGLGLSSTAPSSHSNRLNVGAIAQKSHATLLFYWLGKQQSYLWAITPAKTSLFVLPPQQQISATVDRYTQALTSFKDPLADADSDARSLYAMLVAPAASLIPPGSNVVICADGALSKLNFETLLAPGPASHYWIEDATIVIAPSLSMLASARAPHEDNNKLLMVGDAVSSNPDYPELPLASLEMRLIKQHFAAEKETVLARQNATPTSYLASDPENFAFIHFVAHGTASRTDPLESAIVLSPDRGAEDSFKLYARDIIRHPIDARLVTISACYGSGARTYAGEGLVGLSWSFLRAGAHNVIGALWNVSDESTPRLMDLVYQGIQNGLAPSDALRKAKLAVLHTQGEFRKPFYWAPFQLCVGH